MNIASLLEKSARRFPAHRALSSGLEPHCDYATLAQRVAAIASYLINELNCQPGERIALVMKNSPQYIEVLFGVLHAGLTAVPVNAKLHRREFAYILENSTASHAFISDDFNETIGELANTITTLKSFISVNSRAFQQIYDLPLLALQQCEPDAIAWLFYTSGTTGQPKGAMLSQRNLMAMTQSYFASVDTIESGATLLHAAPMSHGSGLYAFPNIAAGAHQVVTQSGSFEPAEILQLIGHYPQVSMFAAPTMIKRMVETPAAKDENTDNLKVMIYGGGPMYVADLKAAMARFGNKFAQIYGQGETPMTISCLSRGDHLGRDDLPLDELLASVGSAQVPVEIRIADAKGNALPDGEVGEILVSGDTVMLGYWQNPEATAKTIVDGWLYTGDMGVLNAQGYLTLKDRSKDLIISGGTNIYPREVEEILLEHPDIIEVSVIGKEHPDWGEEVIAVVVQRDSAGLDKAQLDTFCLDNMARFKRPKHYHFVAQLPKNNYGKILKTELRALLK
ncbi:AMP-dependent synthetase [Gammaproteobacteria bacterium 53_120_T64]|nr:AMP-dependent synthetase [Gammaproteobacteria bacterium 53_120_T64]